jgi:hypothetical protein
MNSKGKILTEIYWKKSKNISESYCEFGAKNVLKNLMLFGTSAQNRSSFAKVGQIICI